MGAGGDQSWLGLGKEDYPEHEGESLVFGTTEPLCIGNKRLRIACSESDIHGERKEC